MQNVWAPVHDVERIGSNSVSLSCDCNQKIINTTFYLTDWSSTDVKSNKEKAEEFLQFLEDHQITEIDNLYDNYVVSVDYSLYDADMHEVEHSVVIKPLKSSDFVFPLGVSEENECVYRRVKRLTGNLDWIITDRLPYGIMCRKTQKSTVVINDVCVYQDKFEENDTGDHNSVCCQAYNCKSHTINTLLDNKICIYSSKVAGYEFIPIVNEFNPRIVNLDLTIDITNLVVLYNHLTVNKILTRNIAIINNLDVSDDETTGCECNCPNCNGSNNSGSNTDPGSSSGGSSSGSTTDPDPDPNQSSGDSSGSRNNDPDPDPQTPEYVWVKSTSDNPSAKKVVEDLYPEEQFNEDTMVHKSDVIGDIPSIHVGEFVIKTQLI